MKTKEVKKVKKIKRVKTEVLDKIKGTVREVNVGFVDSLDKVKKKLTKEWFPLIERLDHMIELMSNEGLIETKIYKDLVEINKLIKSELWAFGDEGNIDIIIDKLRVVNNYLILNKKIN
jgi:hypothetical protein